MEGLRFITKHAVAAAVVIGGLTAFAAVLYFILLLVAIVTNQPLGGPLALPFLVLLGLLAGTVGVLFVLFPVAVLSDICARALQWPRLAQIPLSVLLLLVYAMTATGMTVALAESPVWVAARAAFIGAVVLLIPLGTYWWAMQSVDWIWSSVKHLIARVAR